jgi:hypothetical protein
MNVGKTLFAQIMELVPWKTFGRIIERHKGDAGVRTLGCADLFRVMVFAQLTWRESLRDIEAYLAANQAKLFHMGLKAPPARSTLADALNLRGTIPAFIHISDGKLHDVNVLDILPVQAGAFYVMDRGSVNFERLYAMHQAGAFFVTRAKKGMDARRVYSTPTNRASGVICDQRVMLGGYYSAKNYLEHLRRIRFKDPESGLSDQQHRPASLDRRHALQEPLAGGADLQTHQALPRHQRERRENADLVRRIHLRANRHRQKGVSSGGFALHMSTDLVSLGPRKKPRFHAPCSPIDPSPNYRPPLTN